MSDIDIIKASERITVNIMHDTEMVQIVKGKYTSEQFNLSLTKEEFRGMIAQYLLLCHMERMKAMSADELLDAISIQL